MNPTRRQFLKQQLLTGSAIIAAGGLSTLGLPAFASAEDVAQALAEFVGDAQTQTGLLTLKTPEIAENGNTVPISISVESDMTEDAYVESVMVLAEGNPSPKVITFHFTPASGQAVASTRMRLAKTQNVIAVAKMSDGSVYTDTKNVKVTIGGCGG
ncbi:MAG: thiosulfate oxidation carrier protein SoxY [Granulosicoccaceae bacterium]